MHMDYAEHVAGRGSAQPASVVVQACSSIVHRSSIATVMVHIQMRNRSHTVASYSKPAANMNAIRDLGTDLGTQRKQWGQGVRNVVA